MMCKRCLANTPFQSGADERNRTSDLLITNQLLYQLSYISEAPYSIKNLSPTKRAYSA